MSVDLCLYFRTEDPLAVLVLRLEARLVLPHFVHHPLALLLNELLAVTHVFTAHQVLMSTLEALHEAASIRRRPCLAHELLVLHLTRLLEFHVSALLPTFVHINLLVSLLDLLTGFVPLASHESAVPIDLLQGVLLLHFVPLHDSLTFGVLRYLVIVKEVHGHVLEEGLLMLVPKAGVPRLVTLTGELFLTDDEFG